MRISVKLSLALALVSISASSLANTFSYERKVFIRGVPGAEVLSVSAPVGAFNAVNIDHADKTSLLVQGFESAMALHNPFEKPVTPLQREASLTVRVGLDAMHYQDVTISAIETPSLEGKLNLTSVLSTQKGVGGFNLVYVQEKANDPKGAIYLTFGKQG